MVEEFSAVSDSGFMARLAQREQEANTLLCVGLDPDLDRIPECVKAGKSPAAAILAFNRAIIAATADLVSCYKPQAACYEAWGPAGGHVLLATREMISEAGALSLLDAKRGDVDNSTRLYAKAIFDAYGFGAVTASPYLGKDALGPFLERSDRGIFVLCRTSNKGAVEFQDLPVGEGEPLYLRVARRVVIWNTNANCGLVVGATFPEEVARVRGEVGDMPLLLPGVGEQKGFLEASVRGGVNSKRGGLSVVVARSVLYASNGSDFADASRSEALRLRDEINKYR